MVDSARMWAVQFAPGSDRIVSCKRVFDTSAQTDDCFIVEARSAEGAADAARLARKRATREKLKGRREAYKKHGLCRCGRAAKAPHQSCESCLESNRKNYHRRASGKPVLTYAERGAATSVGRMRGTDAVRLRTLIEVQDWWRDAATPEDFGRRVASEIKLLTERGFEA